MNSTPSEIQRDFLLEEYQALRDEIVQRVQARQQMWSILLVVAGTFLSVGVQPGIAAWTIFLYPIIALFFAVNWAHNDARIDQLTWYIQRQVEPIFRVTGWETYRAQTFRQKRKTPAQNPLALLPGLPTMSARGRFASTQLIAASIGVYRLAQSMPTGVTLLITFIEVGITIITFLLLADRKAQAVKRLGAERPQQPEEGQP